MMSESVLSQVPDVVLAIQQSMNMGELFQYVRAFAKPSGYDRFIIYTAPSKGEDVIGQLLWLVVVRG